MSRAMKIILVIGIVIVLVGFSGRYFMADSFNTNAQDNNPITRYSNNYMGRGRMFDTFNTSWDNSSEKIKLEDLKNNVDDYIMRFDENLVISDIFVFEDSDYYFSIMEEDTGLGAMELLINPYTGDIYPEFGPNMMWNLKYDMHGSNSRYGMGGRNHMMGRGGMMGRSSYNSNYYIDSENFEGNSISIEDARKLAKDYVESQASEGYTISEGGHEFYGYYTFHIEKENETIGMLSVNGFSGDVWYHDWHGTVKEFIHGH